MLTNEIRMRSRPAFPLISSSIFGKKPQETHHQQLPSKKKKITQCIVIFNRKAYQISAFINVCAPTRKTVREACSIAVHGWFRAARCVEPKTGKNAIKDGADRDAAAIRLKYFTKELYPLPFSFPPPDLRPLDFGWIKQRIWVLPPATTAVRIGKRQPCPCLARHLPRFGPTANVSTYIDASGTKTDSGTVSIHGQIKAGWWWLLFMQANAWWTL